MLDLDKKIGIEIGEAEPHVTDQFAILSSIGQGIHNYTTTQMARYTATLANHGSSYDLFLIYKITDSEDNTVQSFNPTIKNNVSLRGYIWNDVAKGMAMDLYTGEVLALVSKPSYDDNDFILGISEEAWASLNDDERKPMFNRFRQRFAIDPNEDYGKEGLSWRKDESWGNYYVTTLHDYSPAILENAFIYSDNIYFAKAALKISYDDFMSGLDKLGFNQEIPFDISGTKSQCSNTERIETEAFDNRSNLFHSDAFIFSVFLQIVRKIRSIWKSAWNASYDMIRMKKTFVDTTAIPKPIRMRRLCICRLAICVMPS